jgi:hypothetical protein
MDDRLKAIEAKLKELEDRIKAIEPKKVEVPITVSRTKKVGSA